MANRLASEQSSSKSYSRGGIRVSLLRGRRTVEVRLPRAPEAAQLGDERVLYLRRREAEILHRALNVLLT